MRYDKGYSSLQSYSSYLRESITALASARCTSLRISDLPLPSTPQTPSSCKSDFTDVWRRRNLRHRHLPSISRCTSIFKVLMLELGVFREGDVRQNELRTMASSPSLSSTHVGMLMNSSIMVAWNNTILHNPSFHKHRFCSMYLTSR